MNALCAQLFEARIEVFPRLTELHVVAIAESQHRILEIIEARGGPVLQKLPESLRIVRHLPVAIGARDDDQAPLFGEIDGGMVFHSHNARFKSRLLRFLGKASREAFRTSGLRTEQEEQWAQRCRRGRSLGALGIRLGTEQSGQESIQPHPLHGIERCGFRNDRNLGHRASLWHQVPAMAGCCSLECVVAAPSSSVAFPGR
jgi:hypothetical protein